MRSRLFAAVTLSLAAACAGSDGNVRIADDGVPAGEEHAPMQSSVSAEAGAIDGALVEDASVADGGALDARLDVAADVGIDAATDATSDAIVRDAAIENPCFDPALGKTRSIVKPAAGDLLISEWMADPTAVNDAAGEWIEVQATKDVDLNGLQIGNAALGLPLVATNCLSVPAGGFAVFARSTDPQLNGLEQVPVVAPLFVFLNNTSGTLSIGIDNVTLDTVSWTNAAGGISKMIDSEGAQCTAPFSVPPYNAKDIGSPGAPNADCP